MKYYNLKEEKLIIKEITRKGFVSLIMFSNKKQIEKYKKSITQIYKKRLKLGESVGSTNNQCIYNFFYENLNLMPLVYIKN